MVLMIVLQLSLRAFTLCPLSLQDQALITKLAPHGSMLTLCIFRYSHDNIVTCSRDGSAIIWVPRSRRSHVSPFIVFYHWTMVYFVLEDIFSPLYLLHKSLGIFVTCPHAISGKSRTLDSCISSKSATTTPASSTSKRGSKEEIATYSSRRQYDCVESRQPLCTGSYYG